MRVVVLLAILVALYAQIASWVTHTELQLKLLDYRYSYNWPVFSSDDRINDLVMYAYENCTDRLWEWDIIKWGINYSCNDMVFTWTAENGAWGWRVESPTRDHWICQLHYPYHADFIDSPEFKDPYNQLDYCLDERERTMNEGWMKWYAYRVRESIKHLFE